MTMKRFLSTLLVCSGLAGQALAFQPFVVRHIQFSGLKHIARGTALNALPIKVGDSLADNDTTQLIESLYHTGFFDRIALKKKGQTLLVQVLERPTIAGVSIVGNDLLPTKQLQDALKSQGLQTGDMLNPALLDNVKQSLIEQYYGVGKYNARVDMSTSPATHGRVMVNVVISEGLTAKIAGIHLIGNHTFDAKTLAKQFVLTTPNIAAFFTQRDQYSRDKLQASVEKLRSFYLDQGYIEFEVRSTQVSLTPDRKHVYVTVSIREGQQYRLSSVGFKGQKVLPTKVLRKLCDMHIGDIFSRKQVMAARKALSEKLGEKGYAYPKIKVLPKLNKKNHTVDLSFDIHPGRLIYVRRVSFSGNTQTQDIVMRRTMRQMEGGLVNSKAIKSSVRQLNLLGYFKDVQVKMQRVPHTPDQVDVHFKVKEVPSSQATFGVGYSSLDGFLIQAGLAQPNFMGTGKELNVNFANSFATRSYSVTYNNPYYTVNGVSRGFGMHYQTSDPGRVNISNYTMDNLSGSMFYGFPLTENNRFSLSFGAKHQHLKTSSNTSTQVQDFINANHTTFQQFSIGGGWSYNGYDQMPFTTKGLRQSLSASLTGPLDKESLSYYRLNYVAHYFHPLYKKSWIASFMLNAGYGDGFAGTKGLPFFEDYYAGGIGSVRGYEGNTLGPRDSNGDSLGGNVALTGSAELFFPNPIKDGSLRTGVFVDTGNVFQTVSAYGMKATGVDLSDLRYTAGLGVEWRSPFGIIQVSLAEPLNEQTGDHTEFFQFQIGTSF
ncbi:MAG: outer membrane protein assembly factor BamA [marine bacterium B5-7]|nr:MAG: outer membrane protein assembly factor BamA [marine bacterium B5-7]